MLRTRFGRIRAVVSVAVLSLALLAGIVATTEPAAARPNNNMTWLCDAAGGTLTVEANSGYYTYIRCDFPDGSRAECGIGAFGGSYCRFYPATRTVAAAPEMPTTGTLVATAPNETTVTLVAATLDE